jgi:hypothetical protein
VSELSDSEDEEEEEQVEDSDSDDDEPVKQFAFPHLDAEIRAVLQRYDGAVFPKLNWSSPQVRPVFFPFLLPCAALSAAPTAY